MKIKGLTYDQVAKKIPLLSQVIGKNSWEYLAGSNNATVNMFVEGWKDNVRKNVESRLWKKHRGIVKDCVGLAFNKAVIAVGAGQSFNKNKDVLKKISERDGVLDWEDRNFVIIASNHQYKPLLKMGIIPDFVIAVDSSDTIYDQLCTDIPEIGRNTVFLSGLQCSNKVLKEWDKQGRDIRFYLPTTEGVGEAFEKASGKKAKPHKIVSGGNVLNTAWVISGALLHSSVFMTVGNDLSYPLRTSADEQRKLYYADGDYSTNAQVTGTGRDEAKDHKIWMGYTMTKSPIYTDKLEDIYKIEIEPVGTTQTLWVYKSWIEGQLVMNMTANAGSKHYYNCSEGGICGVLCKDDTVDGREKEENWFLLDEVCKQYHTTTLEYAANQFVAAREVQRCNIGVPAAINSVKIV